MILKDLENIAACINGQHCALNSVNTDFIKRIFKSFSFPAAINVPAGQRHLEIQLNPVRHLKAFSCRRLKTCFRIICFTCHKMFPKLNITKRAKDITQTHTQTHTHTHKRHTEILTHTLTHPHTHPHTQRHSRIRKRFRSAFYTLSLSVSHRSLLPLQAFESQSALD